jgi:hypothetical protein
MGVWLSLAVSAARAGAVGASMFHVKHASSRRAPESCDQLAGAYPPTGWEDPKQRRAAITHRLVQTQGHPTRGATTRGVTRVVPHPDRTRRPRIEGRTYCASAGSGLRFSATTSRNPERLAADSWAPHPPLALPTFGLRGPKLSSSTGSPDGGPIRGTAGI